MPVKVQGPDGQTYQFPDGTDKTSAISYFRKKGIGGLAESAAQHAKAGFTTTQGAPPDQPGFTSRLAEATGLPTSREQLKAMQPSMLEILGGPAVTAGKMVAGYGKNLYAGATRPMDPDEAQRMKEHPIGGGVEQASKFILGDILAPVGGQGVNRFAEDLGKGQFAPALGDAAGTALNLLMLKDRGPKTAERLAAGTDAMPKDIRRALPDIAAEVSRSGRPKTLDLLQDRIGEAERRLNQDYANSLGPHANTILPPTAQGTWPISDRIRSLITTNMDDTARGRAAKQEIIKRAAEFEKPWTIGKLDRERIDANNRLNSFYKKGDVDQYAASGSAIGTAIDKAVADAIREHAYPFMDSLAGKSPGYFANLKQRIGSLMKMSGDIKDHAEKLEKQSMVFEGSPAFKRLRMRGVLGESGLPRVFVSDPMAEGNTLKAANKRVKGAFPNPIRQGINSAYVYSYPARQQAQERAQKLVQLLAQGNQ